MRQPEKRNKKDGEKDKHPTHWVEPNAQEIENGWNWVSLNRYLDDRKKAQLVNASKPQEPERPSMQNNRYNPHKLWGR